LKDNNDIDNLGQKTYLYLAIQSLRKKGLPMTIDEIYNDIQANKAGNKRSIKKSLVTTLIRSTMIIRIKKGTYTIKNDE
jgi:hypothetical protein